MKPLIIGEPRIVDLARMPVGTKAIYIADVDNRQLAQQRIGLDARRCKGKVSIKQLITIEPNTLVTGCIMVVSVIEQGAPRKKRGRKSIKKPPD